MHRGGRGPWHHIQLIWTMTIELNGSFDGLNILINDCGVVYVIQTHVRLSYCIMRVHSLWDAREGRVTFCRLKQRLKQTVGHDFCSRTLKSWEAIIRRSHHRSKPKGKYEPASLTKTHFWNFQLWNRVAKYLSCCQSDMRALGWSLFKITWSNRKRKYRNATNLLLAQRWISHITQKSRRVFKQKNYVYVYKVCPCQWMWASRVCFGSGYWGFGQQL